KEQKVTITSGTNLSEEEIEKKVKEAEMNAEADKQKKDKIEALNQADSTIYQTEKTLNELGDKVNADDKSAVETAIDELKSIKEKEEATAEEIKKAMDDLMSKFHKISEQMYQQAQAEQQAQGDAQDQSTNDDNVVDADFTEVNDEK
ncbi:MAG: Hsp70 family protein, partial [Romboutsia sp.]